VTALGGLSRSTVRSSWRGYAGAFVALGCGTVLIASTVTLIGAVEATRTAPGVTRADRTQLEDLSSMFGIMSAVSLFMALFVVGSTFGFVVASRRRELGLLRLVGATPRQVRLLVLGESTVVATAAIVVGSLVATLSAPGLLGLVRALGLTDLHLQTPAPWLAWVVAAGCGAVVALLGASRSARRASRTPPIAALREASLERRRPSLVQWLVALCCLTAVVAAAVLAGRTEPLFVLVASVLLPEVVVIGLVCVGTLVFPRLAGLLARPFVRRDIAARLARDEVRAAARTSTAVASPVVAISAIAGSMVLALSFTVDWTASLDRVQLRAPLVVQTSHPDQLRADPAVLVADVRRQATIRLSGEPEEVDVVDPDTAAAARGLRAVRGSLDDFRGPVVAVSESWTTDSGTGLGGHLRARVDGRPVSLLVVAVVPDAPDLYGELMVPASLVPAVAGGPSTVFVVPRSDVTTVARALSTYGDVTTADRWVDAVTEQNRSANDLGLLVLLGPAGLYAGIAIVNATLIGASQRRREHRLVALLGATPDQVRRTAVWEAALTSGAGLLLGAATTVLVGAMARHAIVRDLAGRVAPADIPMTVPWLPLGATAGTCLLLAALAALSSRGRVSRDAL
jgi:putative ABC transport system permease protein